MLMLANNQSIDFSDVEDMLIKTEDTIHHNFVFSKINYQYFNYKIYKKMGSLRRLLIKSIRR
jgi:hypothetical protein